MEADSKNLVLTISIVFTPNIFVASRNIIFKYPLNSLTTYF